MELSQSMSMRERLQADDSYARVAHLDVDNAERSVAREYGFSFGHTIDGPGPNGLLGPAGGIGPLGPNARYEAFPRNSSAVETRWQRRCAWLRTNFWSLLSLLSVVLNLIILASLLPSVRHDVDLVRGQTQSFQRTVDTMLANVSTEVARMEDRMATFTAVVDETEERFNIAEQHFETAVAHASATLENVANSTVQVQTLLSTLGNETRHALVEITAANRSAMASVADLEQRVLPAFVSEMQSLNVSHRIDALQGPLDALLAFEGSFTSAAPFDEAGIWGDAAGGIAVACDTTRGSVWNATWARMHKLVSFSFTLTGSLNEHNSCSAGNALTLRLPLPCATGTHQQFGAAGINKLNGVVINNGPGTTGWLCEGGGDGNGDGGGPNPSLLRLFYSFPPSAGQRFVEVPPATAIPVTFQFEGTIHYVTD